MDTRMGTTSYHTMTRYVQHKQWLAMKTRDANKYEQCTAPLPANSATVHVPYILILIERFWLIQLFGKLKTSFFYLEFS